jgi:hypothetical protein
VSLVTKHGSKTPRVSPSPETSILLQLRGGEKGVAATAGGGGGLLCLRWPLGHREVAETAVLLPAGGVRPSLGFPRSRVWFPVGVAEALAATLAWNKSVRAEPRPAGVLLRRRWRVRGGGSPAVGPLYRSQPPVFLYLRVRRGDEQAGLLMQGGRGSCGSAAGWRMD